MNFLKISIFIFIVSLMSIGIAGFGKTLRADQSASTSNTSSIQFEEVTSSAGISHVGMSFGLSWGDFNGDGWPDLWACNHYTMPSLYINQGDGTFIDMAGSVWTGSPTADTHGSAWGDFDNDSDQDLMEMVGADQGEGAGRNHLFVNTDGLLLNQGVQLGIDDPLGRGRTPLWLDWNKDGALDLMIANLARSDGQSPSIVFQQTITGFQPADVGFDAPDYAQYAQLSDLSGDGQLDLVVHGWPYPQKVYDMTTDPFTDLTTSIRLQSTTLVQDTILADFNGDLRTDIYLVRLDQDASDYLQVDDHEARLFILLHTDQKGLIFKTTGDATFSLYNTGMDAFDIFVGPDGHHPETCCSLTLSPDDPTIAGMPDFTPGVDQGVFIGYDPSTQIWQMLASSPSSYLIGTAIITTTEPMSDMSLVGYDPADRPQYDRLMVYANKRFTDASEAAGLVTPTDCKSGAAGDFDNDMDIDIYLVCSRNVANPPNILYENQGGVFVAVPDAGGAAGSTIGAGESVAIADYDRDGFLDLWVTNGEAPPPSPLFSGPDQLFHNVGNSNHWLEIDLIGTTSNRDGIGARILATTGEVTQLREQNGGMHNRSQNDKRIHFGLGSNTQVDHLLIQWPSGIYQQIDNVAADQILQVKEPFVINLPIIFRGG